MATVPPELLTGSGQFDVFHIAGTTVSRSGNDLFFTATSNGVSLGPGHDWMVGDYAGNVVATAANPNGWGLNAVSTFLYTVPINAVPGFYYFVIGRTSDFLGIALRVGRPIACGDTKAGSLRGGVSLYSSLDPSGGDAFSFTGTAGQTITVNASASARIDLRIYDERAAPYLTYGTILGADATGTNVTKVATLPGTGLYSVALTNLISSGALTYSLSFLCSGTMVPGCTDPTAENYNPAATMNNGSCVYGVGNGGGSSDGGDGYGQGCKVVLSWSFRSGVTWTVQRAADAAFTQNLVTLATGLTVNTLTDPTTTADNGLPHYYRVRAVSAGGVGSWDNITVVASCPVLYSNCHPMREPTICTAKTFEPTACSVFTRET